MDRLITLLGYGEAGQTFSRAAGWGRRAKVYDIKTGDRLTQAAMHAIYDADGVESCEDMAAALAETDIILSLVTADQAFPAANDVSMHISPAALYFDMNSVAPGTKRAAAQVIEAAGGRYVDVAILAPVAPVPLAVPLLLSGRYAEEGASALTALGFSNVQVIPGEVGQASLVKMIRSVMVKGQEALTAEMMLAARKAGVVDEVLSSLGDGWTAKVDYNLDRMKTHGRRRAAEMEEVAKTLCALGIDPFMTNGTVKWQRVMAA